MTQGSGATMATRRGEDGGDGTMFTGEGRGEVSNSNLKNKDYKKANRERCCSSLSKNYEAAASTSPLTRQRVVPLLLNI